METQKRKAGSIFLAVFLALFIVLTSLANMSATAETSEDLYDLFYEAGHLTYSEAIANYEEATEALCDAFSRATQGYLVDFSTVSFGFLESMGIIFMQPTAGVFYYLQDGVLMVDDSGSGSHSSSHHTASHNAGRRRAVEDGSDIAVDATIFNNVVNNLNLQYLPHGKNLRVLSWKNDDFPVISTPNLAIVTYHNLFQVSGLTSAYAVAYYIDGSDVYYGNYRFYLHFDENYTLLCDIYDCDNLTSRGENFTIANCADSAGTALLTVDGQYWDNIVFTYGTNDRNLVTRLRGDGALGCTLHKSDLSKDLSFGKSTLSDLSDKNGTRDYGFVWSAEEFEVGNGAYADVPTDLPDNYYITFTGDTIYDYTITDPDSGKSGTVNYYITNNYVLPDTPIDTPIDTPSGGSSSGDVNVGGNVTVDGNVTVGGQIDVNSKVEVDVNVTGDIGSSGGGNNITIINGGGVSYGETVEMPDDAFLENLGESAAVIKPFYQRFFDFLPPELLGLILGAISVAVLCRVFGR